MHEASPLLPRQAEVRVLHDVQADGIRADLGQLGELLDDAIARLTASFESISETTAASGAGHPLDLARVEDELGRAAIALQFHDIATQIVSRSVKRLDGMRESTTTRPHEDATGATAATTEDRDEISVGQARMTVGEVELF